MKKSDLKDAGVDQKAKYQIVLSKFVYEEDNQDYESGWDCDIWVDDWYVGGGTAPTQAGVYDLANEIIYDYENPRDF